MADPILPMYKNDIHDSNELSLNDTAWTPDEEKLFNTLFSDFNFQANVGNVPAGFQTQYVQPKRLLQEDLSGYLSHSPQELSPEPSPDSGYSSSSPLQQPTGTGFEFMAPGTIKSDAFQFNTAVDPNLAAQMQMDPESFAAFYNTLKADLDPTAMEDMDLNEFGLVDPMTMQSYEDNATSEHKKKRSASTMEGAPAAPVQKLSKEELAKLSSKELEEYTKRLQDCSMVTPEELRELKRQRRLVRNREYAHFSRAKKKEYMGDLEGKVKELNDQTNQLTAKVAALTVENKALKAKVIHLQKMVKQSTVLSTLLTNMTSIKQAQPVAKPEPSNNFKGAVGVCVLILLFSFGLFFNATDRIGTRVPFTAYIPDPISDALPQDNWVGSSTPLHFPTRVLLEFSVDDKGIKISVGDSSGTQTVFVTIQDKFGTKATTFEKSVNDTETAKEVPQSPGQQDLGVRFSNDTMPPAKEGANADHDDCHGTHSCPKEEL